MLKKLPRSIGKLKKITTLSLDGCSNLAEFPTEMNNIESLEVLNAKTISINSQNSTYAFIQIVPRNPKSFFHSLPPSLVTLSLGNNHLVNEFFPMDFSSLIMLKNLYLDGNPIVSLPNCVRSLSMLQLLTMNCCYLLKTVEHPPGTIRALQLDGCTSLLKIAFAPDIFTPTLPIIEYEASESLNEIEGVFKIQPLAHVKEEVLKSLGWTNLEYVKNQEVEAWYSMKGLGPKLPAQMYYEFGIFSTVFGGKGVPKWISQRTNGSSISFTVPSSSNNLRGLSLCSVHTISNIENIVPFSDIKISNITKNLTWIYFPYIDWVRVVDEGVVWLSHWMFGNNELEDGDQIIVTIEKDKIYDVDVIIREGGISLVYDEGNMEEDVLGYYKSWNHIICGDLSAFQLTTGEYF